MTKILNPQIYKTSVADFLVGGKIYTYIADTDTLKLTYQTVEDAREHINPNTNPIILDAKGRARIVTDGPTKLVLKDENDNIIWTVNDIDVSELNLLDANGNEVLVFHSIANAVNSMEVRNAITGAAPRISAVGSDEDIDFVIKPKGTGNTTVTTGGIKLEHGNLTITAGNAILTSGDLSVGVGTITVESMTGVSSFPLLSPGSIAWFAGSAAPSGWLECNGGAVSRTTYADLFNKINTTYGAGDGSTTFNLPVQARNALVGKGGSGTGILGNTTGSIGGAETHSLSVSEIPAHNHSYTIPGNQGDGPPNNFANQGLVAMLTDTNTNATGNGTAYNIMQPSLVMMMIIKT